MSDTVVDKVAKLLTPPGNPNWHLSRGWARVILAEAAHLKTGELSTILLKPDREITHEELARVAQPVERVVEGHGVGGSTPSSGTN